MNIEFKNICFSYNTPLSIDLPVLNNINLNIFPGEIVGILGRSGSGKTTLIQLLNGLLKPTTGTVLIDERDLWNSGLSFTEVRKKIGLAFQFPENQFFEETVFKEIAFGLKNQNFPDVEIERRVKSIMNFLSLDSEDWYHRNPYFLSTGEKRRIALVSILVLEPEILVLDEPTAGLDASGIKLLESMVHNFLTDNRSVIIVTHNVEMICQLAQRVIVLNDGTKVFDDNVAQLLENSDRILEWGIKPPRYWQFLNLFKKNYPESFDGLISEKEFLRKLMELDEIIT